MRNSSVVLVGVLLAFALAGLHFAAPDGALNLPFTTRSGVNTTISINIEEPLGLLSSEQSGATTIHSDGNYRIQIIESTDKARSTIRVIVNKKSGEKFRVNGFSITARVNRAAIQGVWNPGADPSSTNVMVTDGNHSIDDISDANYGIPFIAAASAAATNVFAMGLGRQDLSVSVGGQPVDNNYEFRLKALTPRSTSTLDEQFYISNDASMTWFETAGNYADWVDTINNYEPFPVTERAYEPLYDTWYWSGDRVDDRLYLETARLASELGMGLYLADSGWDTPAGEYEKWLAGETGDYAPPPDKFGDLAHTFDTIRTENQLGIDLWLQPFAVGRASRLYLGTKDLHIQIPERRYAAMGWPGLAYAPFAIPLGNNLETVNLCPRMALTQAYLKNLLTDVATKYNPEGYWIDFIDGMAAYCTAPHVHNYSTFGEGFRQSLEAIKSTILSYNPTAVVHFRARYANLNNKSFANVWQSGDSPSDFDRMRLNSIRLRPFSKGVVFAADQMYWPDDTNETQVSKFIMTSVMVGVPAFGPTLIYSPPETLALLKAWLTFYRQHRLEIASGTLTPFGELQMPSHKIESGTNTFAYIRNLNFSEVAAESKSVFLMNATDGDQIRGRVRVPGGVGRYSVKVLNRFLVAEANPLRAFSDARGILNLNVAVEQGGMVILTPQTITPAAFAAGAISNHHPTFPPAGFSCGGSCRFPPN